MENGSEYITSLIKSLNHPDKRVIRSAVESLITEAYHNPQLQNTLNCYLKDLSYPSRWPLAYILAQISSPSSHCLDVLVEALDHKDGDIRWAVALLLVRLAKEDERHLPLIFDLVRSGSSVQKRMAVYCLRDLKLTDDDSLRALLASIEDPDPLVRVAVVTSLNNREVGKNGMNILIRLFREDPDSRVRNATALMLGKLGENTQEIRSTLAEADFRGDPQIEKAAHSALRILSKKRPVS